MESFFYILGGFFAFIFIWGTVGDIRSWLENREFEKRMAESKNDTSIDDYFAAIAALPDPWLGMHESELDQCNWTFHYTSFSDITTRRGVNRCYFYNYRGYLHFTNGKLVSIVRIG